jgi:hypothetical protein
MTQPEHSNREFSLGYGGAFAVRFEFGAFAASGLAVPLGRTPWLMRLRLGNQLGRSRRDFVFGLKSRSGGYNLALLGAWRTRFDAVFGRFSVGR